MLHFCYVATRFPPPSVCHAIPVSSQISTSEYLLHCSWRLGCCFKVTVPPLVDMCTSLDWTWPEGSRCLGGCRIAATAAENGINVEHHSSLSSTELCKTFLPSFEKHSQNVPLHTPKLLYGAIFPPATPETWQECLYTTLYSLFLPLKQK